MEINNKCFMKTLPFQQFFLCFLNESEKPSAKIYSVKNLVSLLRKEHMFGIMKRKGSIDMKLLSEPIDAIVRFRASGDGTPLPYKFRYKDSYDNAYEVRIDRIDQVKEWRFGGKRSFVYRCTSNICGAQRMYEIRYLVDECRWELYKM